MKPSMIDYMDGLTGLGIEFTESECSTVEWIDGLESQTIRNIINIIEKVKEKALTEEKIEGEEMTTCKSCKNFIGMGDFALCCTVKPDLCYADTHACEQFESKEKAPAGLAPKASAK